MQDFKGLEVLLLIINYRLESCVLADSRDIFQKTRVRVIETLKLSPLLLIEAAELVNLAFMLLFSSFERLVVRHIKFSLVSVRSDLLVVAINDCREKGSLLLKFKLGFSQSNC